MPENTAELAERASLTPSKACNYCRSRKIRCDKTSPCSNCQRLRITCTTAPRAARPRRQRVLISSQYDDKIDDINARLDQLNQHINTLVAGSTPSQVSRGAGSSTRSPSTHSTRSPLSHHTTASNAGATPSSHNECQQNFQFANTRIRASQEQEDEPVVEGLSSLSANSTFAVDRLRKVAGADREKGHNFDTRELLDKLHQIVNAIKHRELSPELLLPHALPPARSRDDFKMPPIEATVAVIRKGQEQRNYMLRFLSVVLQAESLSELCLKVYFSGEYSEAEFIIINTTLHYLFGNIDLEQDGQLQPGGSQEDFKLLCRVNLETALSRLSLYFKATYDMVLALILGAFYAVDIARPSLAWTYTVAAYHASHALGFHTRAKGADPGSDVPNNMGLLFWIIFCLEKPLSLRLGRCSSISDIEITVPLPGSSQTSVSPVMSYFHQSIRISMVTARIYERLYSEHSLSAPDNVREQVVSELSQEMLDIQDKSRAIIKLLLQTETDKYTQDVIEFVSSCDEVYRLSVLTLIHRAAPEQVGSVSTFSDECIFYARAALEYHKNHVQSFGIPELISEYVNWTILFSPFIPFIVLFCCVLETGDEGDLARMQAFVSSLETASEHSSVIAKHHILFQGFHNVAVRYKELKSASTPVQQEQEELRLEMDSFLSELGFQTQAGSTAANATQDMALERPSGARFGEGVQSDMPKEYQDVEQALRLPRWYTMNQQIIGLLDNDEFPF
ncbi:uncharacterized protein F4812DRAFT_450270 [Daldinia caldariorum]|uniref:uncharacterized protein n=1 Tax=Daldinia caldariorum TaxID=326644 RepID=UPI002007E207|nr:uncharacterized protein F4812DRAFT_450270 [Daldinia caldariorum]KAI1469858.1 hypothetical protein F4812DRAFT_450270 [Daldinia caldariorum]